MTERLTETGTVSELDGSFLRIKMTEGENCHTCGAKIFCSSRSSSDREIRTLNSINAAIGDTVEISISGKLELITTSLLYGAPLILIICGILLGNLIFGAGGILDLYSALLGFGLTSIYFAVFSFLAKTKYLTQLQNKVTLRKR